MFKFFERGCDTLKIKLTLISILLLCSIVLNLTACTVTVKAADLMEGITPNEVKGLDDLDEYNPYVVDFAIRLFKSNNKQSENVLISPLSVMCALAMTVNGADGETRAQIESALGMRADELNLYVYTYMNRLASGEKYKLSMANSIWFADSDHFLANQKFLQANADYYGAGIFKTSFDDQTLKDINLWVKKATDGMIGDVLDRIPSEAVMYLVNALAFEAEWSEIYKKEEVRGGTFTKEDGSVQNADMMYSSESVYLEDDNATGFIKYYKDQKYAFVALLPNEGLTVSEYVASLNGEALYALLNGAQSITVKTAIPKFESEFDTEMSEALKSMGMIDAFDENKADFSKLGSSSAGNIFINRVIHKTYISVGEKGTRAGAATTVEMANKFAAPDGMDVKQVYLDRPFVYMLIDCENNIPFFIGTMTNVNG